jgi:hypothetical protein
MRAERIPNAWRDSRQSFLMSPYAPKGKDSVSIH